MRRCRTTSPRRRANRFLQYMVWPRFIHSLPLSPAENIRLACALAPLCYVRGAQLIIDELEKQLGIKVGRTTEDGMFTLNATRCIGCCGLAPAMMINDDVYGQAGAR